MMRAYLAANLLAHPKATLRPQACVFIELLALGTDRLAAIGPLAPIPIRMVARAIDRHHLRDGPLLALPLLLYLGIFAHISIRSFVDRYSSV